MIKTIFRELMITLLLCIAILLVLSILFYDYNPINKVVPNKIAYSVPDTIKNELEEETLQNTFSVENKVYTIEGSDLNIYKKSNSYNPSKVNPFVSTPSEDTNVVTNTLNQNTQGGTTNVNKVENSVGVNTNTSGGKNTGLK